MSDDDDMNSDETRILHLFSIALGLEMASLYALRAYASDSVHLTVIKVVLQLVLNFFVCAAADLHLLFAV